MNKPNLAFSILGALLLACAARAGFKEPLDTFNYFLGTQTIGIKYKFTDKTGLIETAERIRDMGSNIIKISMGREYCGRHYSLPKREDILSLRDLAEKDPSFRAVFDMPFAYYFIWAYGFSSVRWNDGLSETERQSEYREMYDLTRYLLERYNGSGKTFLLGHWEGDWHLVHGYNAREEPAPEAIQGMIAWLNVRQKAVDDAARDARAGNVRVYHYTEVNLVRKGIEGGKCLANDVLPFTSVDYVSYSCYDTINAHPGNTREPLFKALDHIASKLPPKKGFDGKRVFIGEYGFPLEGATTPEKQDLYCRDVCRAALEWGCPFALYWQMYCNEKREERHRGYWLVDDKNREQPFFFTLRDYYRQMKNDISAFRQEHGRPPATGEAQRRALEILKRELEPESAPSRKRVRNVDSAPRETT